MTYRDHDITRTPYGWAVLKNGENALPGRAQYRSEYHARQALDAHLGPDSALKVAPNPTSVPQGSIAAAVQTYLQGETTDVVAVADLAGRAPDLAAAKNVQAYFAEAKS